MKSHDNMFPCGIQGIFASYVFVLMHYSTDFLLDTYYVSCTLINTGYRVVNKTRQGSCPHRTYNLVGTVLMMMMMMMINIL